MKNHSLRVEVVEKLDRAGVVVTDLARDPRRGFAQLADAPIVGSPTLGAIFDDLLVPPLHRAIALVQVDHVAVLIAENLHFDVLGARDVFFEKDGRIAEGALRFALRLVEQRRQVAGFVDDAHAAPAAAERRLDDAAGSRSPSRSSSASSRSVDRLLRPGQRRDAELSARARARPSCRPYSSSSSGRGPTNTMPARSQARANSAFSERNP